jgi:peptidoglycan hydrolase-like protein with peptidoglycan-binding domain
VKPADRKRNDNEYAVWKAVAAYQVALNRRLGTRLTVDGIFGGATVEAVTKFQTAHEAKTGTPWGGIGPQTSRALLRPDMKQIVLAHGNDLITPKIVSGTINHESQWDAGAIGYLDDTDFGLAQINGTAHPDLSRAERLNPSIAFNFVVNYYENALSQLNNNVRDAIASYNLGIGGARRWISQGRPEWYTPEGATRARNVWQYIDSILAG